MQAGPTARQPTANASSFTNQLFVVFCQIENGFSFCLLCIMTSVIDGASVKEDSNHTSTIINAIDQLARRRPSSSLNLTRASSPVTVTKRDPSSSEHESIFVDTMVIFVALLNVVLQHQSSSLLVEQKAANEKVLFGGVVIFLASFFDFSLREKSANFPGLWLHLWHPQRKKRRTEG